MCRSIKTLRPPFVDGADDDDVRAAALRVASPPERADAG
jgi:hypothetical protein